MADVLDAFREVLGQANVDTRPEALDALNADVGEFTSRSWVAKLQPRSADQVARVVALAHRHRGEVSLHPVSTGLNWGFGSRKPVRGPVALLDLAGLDRIRHLDIDQGTAIVEPGVTQQALVDALRRALGHHRVGRRAERGGVPGVLRGLRLLFVRLWAEYLLILTVCVSATAPRATKGARGGSG